MPHTQNFRQALFARARRRQGSALRLDPAWRGFGLDTVCARAVWPLSRPPFAFHVADAFVMDGDLQRGF